MRGSLNMPWHEGTPQCQTCQFWRVYETANHSVRGECLAVVSLSSQKEHFSEYKSAVPQGEPLLTGPMFGCVLHRQK